MAFKPYLSTYLLVVQWTLNLKLTQKIKVSTAYNPLNKYYPIAFVRWPGLPNFIKLGQTVRKMWWNNQIEPNEMQIWLVKTWNSLRLFKNKWNTYAVWNMAQKFHSGADKTSCIETLNLQFLTLYEYHPWVYFSPLFCPYVLCTTCKSREKKKKDRVGVSQPFQERSLSV